MQKEKQGQVVGGRISPSGQAWHSQRERGTGTTAVLTWGRPSNAVYSVLQDLRDVYNYAARIWQLSQNYFPIYYKYCFNEKGSLDNWNFQFGKYKELWLEMSDKTGPTLQNHFQEKITTVREKKNRWYSKFTLIYTFHSGYGGFPVLLTKDISLI